MIASKQPTDHLASCSSQMVFAGDDGRTRPNLFSLSAPSLSSALSAAPGRDDGHRQGFLSRVAWAHP
ncbi:MAG: hypothetical protein GYB65_13485 [Chloroflexi bacterium]|nr:hypothetical protein [Chloroflexota bacterium]